MVIPDWLFAIILASPIFGVMLGFIFTYTERNGKYLLYGIVYGILVFTFIINGLT